MRLEIIIPDSTGPDLKARLTVLTQRLSETPELVDEIELDDDPESLFTPAVVADIRAAAVEARTGNNISFDQLKAEMKQKRTEWLANHPA